MIYPTLDNPFVFQWKGKLHAKKNERDIIPPKKEGGKYLLVPPRAFIKQQAIIRNLMSNSMSQSEFEVVPRSEEMVYIVRFCVYKSPTSKSQKGDKDNMLTSLLDIGNTVIYEDDSQVNDGYPHLRRVPNATLEHFKVAFWKSEEGNHKLQQINEVYKKYFWGVNDEL